MCRRSKYNRSSVCCLLATMHVLCKTKCTAVTRTKAGGGSAEACRPALQHAFGPIHSFSYTPTGPELQVYGARYGSYSFLWGPFQIRNPVLHPDLHPLFPCDKPALDPDCPDVAVIAEVYELLKLVQRTVCGKNIVGL